MTPTPGNQSHTREYFNLHAAFWQQVYDRADTYAAHSLLMRHEFAMRAVAAAGAGAGMVLDVGCGAGVTVRALRTAGWRAYGVDYSARMIERAVLAGGDDGNEWFVVAGAGALALPAQSMDAVIGLGLLGNIRHLDDVLGELHRVLKKDGLLLVTMPNAIALDRFIGLPRALPLFLGWPARKTLRRLSNRLRRSAGLAEKDDSTLRYGRSMIPGQMVRRLRSHGFSEVKFHGLAFGPLRPFGLRFLREERVVWLSAALAKLANRVPLLRPLASTIIYTAHKR